MASVAVRDVVKVYRRDTQEVRVLDGLSLDIADGEFVALMGPSGSGKTTLLNLIGGIDQPTSGDVIVGGTSIGRLGGRALADWRAASIGFIFQLYNLMPVLTAQQNVELPLLLDGLPQRQIRLRADRLLELCQLTRRAHHLPDELSGGEQQRVAIARALLNEPALLLADEPTGNLDSKTAGTILVLLRQLVSEFGKTVLMVTHEPRGASLADVLVLLKDGRIVHQEKLSVQGDAAAVADRYKQYAG